MSCSVLPLLCTKGASALRSLVQQSILLVKSRKHFRMEPSAASLRLPSHQIWCFDENAVFSVLFQCEAEAATYIEPWTWLDFSVTKVHVTFHLSITSQWSDTKTALRKHNLTSHSKLCYGNNVMPPPTTFHTTAQIPTKNATIIHKRNRVVLYNSRCKYCCKCPVDSLKLTLDYKNVTAARIQYI